MNLLSTRSRQKLFTARTLAEAGILRPTRPDKALRIANAAAPLGADAGRRLHGVGDPRPRRDGDRRRARDADLRRGPPPHERAGPRALATPGVKEGDGVAIMCRNHRGFIDATVACSKLGAHALYLNTAVRRAADHRRRRAREAGRARLRRGVRGARRTTPASAASASSPGTTASDEPKDPLLEDLIAAGDPADVVPPAEQGPRRDPHQRHDRHAEGRPAQAARVARPGRRAASRRSRCAPREPTMIAAPMFHSWGFAHFTLGMGLGSTLVLRRKFDPEDTLSATAAARVHGARRRPGDAPAHPRAAAPRRSTATTSAPCASSPPAAARCPASWPLEVMDRFGDVLYNLYGSTEVAWATIATPEDLRAAPGTAGRPPRGTIVKLLDEEGNEVAPGETGRIFVGNEMAFEGYTGGGSKEIIDGLMSSGDVGHFDDGGRLFVDGRDDEMIVSGGENVFPREVEDLLADHDGGRRGRGHRRRRRAVRPAPEGLRRGHARGERRRGRAQGPTSRRTSPATRSRARSCSSTSCRATPPARSSSASWPSAE